MREETYISVDIEADGSQGAPPGDYSILSIGAVNVLHPQATFYVELKPIGNTFDPEALKVCGLDRDALLTYGQDPRTVMPMFADWCRKQGDRPIFVSFSTWDWAMVWWYLQRYLGRTNPFSHSSLDIKSYYMGRYGVPWSDTTKRHIKQHNPSLLAGLGPHTHNALDDAKEQGELFRRLLES